MNNSELLFNHGITQPKLAELLGEGIVTLKTRVRANRIWNGQRPNHRDMTIIFKATNGSVTANDFYNLPINGHKVTKVKSNKHRSS